MREEHCLSSLCCIVYCHTSGSTRNSKDHLVLAKVMMLIRNRNYARIRLQGLLFLDITQHYLNSCSPPKDRMGEAMLVYCLLHRCYIGGQFKWSAGCIWCTESLSADNQTTVDMKTWCGKCFVFIFSLVLSVNHPVSVWIQQMQDM